MNDTTKIKPVNWCNVHTQFLQTNHVKQNLKKHCPKNETNHWMAPMEKSSGRAENWLPKHALYLDAKGNHCANACM